MGSHLCRTPLHPPVGEGGCSISSHTLSPLGFPLPVGTLGVLPCFPADLAVREEWCLCFSGIFRGFITVRESASLKALRSTLSLALPPSSILLRNEVFGSSKEAVLGTEVIACFHPQCDGFRFSVSFLFLCVCNRPRTYLEDYIK